MAFRRPTISGADENYDTLDDVILNNSCIEELFEKINFGLKGAVGISISGDSTLADPSDGYWGRSICLPTGEHLQVRILPRGCVGVPLGPQDFRLISARRTSHGTVPQVAFAIFFLPRDEFSLDTTQLTCGSTVGCRGVHVLLPSLFGKHDPHRVKSSGHATIDTEDFHSIRPSSLYIPLNKGVKKAGVGEFALTAGDSYIVIAGGMAGVDIPDPLRRCAEVMNGNDHSRHIIAKQRRMIQSIGEHDTGAHVYAALTLCELLSAEGFLSMLCNSFFYGAMPDMMHSPIGLPLSICMAVHIAVFHERFGLAPCTKADNYANKEIIHAFHSRWKRLLLNGFRALDVCVKSGYDRAVAQAEKDPGMQMQIGDSMLLWQRIGQRMIAKVVSDPRDEVFTPTRNPYDTRFGAADLVKDPISDAKYDFMAKKGFCKSIRETPIDKIFLAPRCDLRTTLYRVLDNSEAWLRTGMFGQLRISQENVNIAPAETVRNTRMPCEICGSCYDCMCKVLNPNGAASSATSQASSSSSDESDDADDLLDNKLCVHAMEAGAGAIAISIIHGPFSMHQFGIKCMLLGPGCKNTCADCDAQVDAFQGTVFSSKAGECPTCNRKRCFKCSTASMKTDRPRTGYCMRCDPSAPRARNNVVLNAKRQSKSTKK